MTKAVVGWDEKYKGKTFSWSRSYMWEGIYNIYARTWDTEIHDEVQVMLGSDYDCSEEYLLAQVEIGITAEVMADAQVEFLRRSKNAWNRYVSEERCRICKDRRARVIRGRKVRIGTELEIFWVGERATYWSMTHDWCRETETIAGGYDDNGNKVWIKAEYLENLTPVEFSAEDEKMWRKKWLMDNLPKGLRGKINGRGFNELYAEMEG